MDLQEFVYYSRLYKLQKFRNEMMNRAMLNLQEKHTALYKAFVSARSKTSLYCTECIRTSCNQCVPLLLGFNMTSFKEVEPTNILCEICTFLLCEDCQNVEQPTNDTENDQ